jgi:hypothetical protein
MRTDKSHGDPPSTVEQLHRMLHALIRTSVKNEVPIEGSFPVWEAGNVTGWDIEITRIDRRGQREDTSNF